MITAHGPRFRPSRNGRIILFRSEQRRLCLQPVHVRDGPRVHGCRLAHATATVQVIALGAQPRHFAGLILQSNLGRGGEEVEMQQLSVGFIVSEGMKPTQVD